MTWIFSDRAWVMSIALAKHMADDVRRAQRPPMFDGQLGALRVIIGEGRIKNAWQKNIDDNVETGIYSS